MRSHKAWGKAGSWVASSRRVLLSSCIRVEDVAAPLLPKKGDGAFTNGSFNTSPTRGQSCCWHSSHGHISGLVQLLGQLLDGYRKALLHLSGKAAKRV